MNKQIDSKLIARAMILKLRKCAMSADQKQRAKIVTRLVKALEANERGRK